MTELAVYQPPTAGLAIPDRDVVDGWIAVASDVIKVANLINETDFVPAEYRGNAPAVAAAMLTGRELGIGPMMSLRHVQIVKGVPTLSAEYKRARVLAAGHDFEVIEHNTQRCKVRGRRAGTSKWLETSFSIEDAKRAKIYKPGGAWETRPRRMLFARAGSELCDFMFADVTNGLPTAELVASAADDDEFAGYNESPTQAAPAESNGHDPAKPAPRTARRARGASEPRPTTAAPAAATAPTTAPVTAQAAPSGDGLPPLPGEEEPSEPAAAEPDETDYDTHGTVTTARLTAIWTIFTKVYGFTADEKDHARTVAAHIIGRELTSTREMSQNEAKAVLDTLSNWRQIAEQRGETPRDVLVAMMAAGDEAHAQAAAGEPDGGPGDQ